MSIVFPKKYTSIKNFIYKSQKADAKISQSAFFNNNKILKYIIDLRSSPLEDHSHTATTLSNRRTHAIRQAYEICAHNIYL